MAVKKIVKRRSIKKKPVKKAEYCRMTIEVLKEDHKRLKTLAAATGKSMKDLVSVMLNTNLQANLNEETLKAIDQIENGEGLCKAKDAKDLFDKLGL